MRTLKQVEQEITAAERILEHSDAMRDHVDPGGNLVATAEDRITGWNAVLRHLMAERSHLLTCSAACQVK